MVPDFDKMTETDVREVIVRPLIESLGYKYGTNANIRTEVPLRYSRVILGRKNEKRDPPVAGKADYVCDAVSYGRWVVEVKSPRQPLTQDDVEQAQSYCAHAEIAAVYFILSNGREFRLYATSNLAAPLLAWKFEDTETQRMTLLNILSYDAIKKLSAILKPDVSKPLGKGLKSSAQIVGGQVKYGPHHSTHPLLAIDSMNGLVGSVTGVGVDRSEDGRLHAHVSVLSPYQQMAALNKLAGIDDFHFYSSDEYVSDDIAAPTIFQNITKAQLPPGIRGKLVPYLPEFVMPVGFSVTAFSDAAGYVENGDTFKGVAFLTYDYTLVRGPPSGIPELDALIANMPLEATIEGESEFSIVLR